MKRLLDLYCGAGGCSRGYMNAGFHVTGVDINAQKNYCGDEFVQADAIEYVLEHGNEFDVIHASPPCQPYTKAKFLVRTYHPELIEATRKAMLTTGKPFAIENVLGAPLINPIALTGNMFGLMTMRPRLFEIHGAYIAQPELPPQVGSTTKMGRQPKPGEYVHVVGHVTDIEYCKKAMGIDWMNRAELGQAIPPAYTEFIGKKILYALENLTCSVFVADEVHCGIEEEYWNEPFPEGFWKINQD